MIQFKRGKTKTWKNLKKPLADGQPGYDREKHKLKIGDGESSWENLPNIGLSPEEVLSSEQDAKENLSKGLTEVALFTYGTASPNSDTKGQVYLQQYEAESEADYIMDMGLNKQWLYRKWHSGIAECWCTTELSNLTPSKALSGSFYTCELDCIELEYPIRFLKDLLPYEITSLYCNKQPVWLLNKTRNTSEKTGKYNILSLQQEPVTVFITFYVTGYWR